jgi:hypothetical protein
LAATPAVLKLAGVFFSATLTSPGGHYRKPRLPARAKENANERLDLVSRSVFCNPDLGSDSLIRYANQTLVHNASRDTVMKEVILEQHRLG